MNKMWIAALAAGTLVAGIVLYLRRPKESAKEIERAHRGEISTLDYAHQRGQHAMG